MLNLQSNKTASKCSYKRCQRLSKTLSACQASSEKYSILLLVEKRITNLFTRLPRHIDFYISRLFFFDPHNFLVITKNYTSLDIRKNSYLIFHPLILKFPHFRNENSFPFLSINSLIFLPSNDRFFAGREGRWCFDHGPFPRKHTVYAQVVTSPFSPSSPHPFRSFSFFTSPRYPVIRRSTTQRSGELWKGGREGLGDEPGGRGAADTKGPVHVTPAPGVHPLCFAAAPLGKRK